MLDINAGFEHLTIWKFIIIQVLSLEIRAFIN